MHAMQAETRGLCGGLGHLSRFKCNITLDHAICAQGVSRPTYETFEHLKEILRFAWATEDDEHEHVGLTPTSIVISDREEPIRPYDDEVERGLYELSDAMHANPVDNVPGSKSMGGYAIMFGGAAIEWASWRFHCITTDITSAEVMAKSRGAGKLIFYQSLAQFIGVPMPRPLPSLTDNDGCWYVARDAKGTTKMIHVIKHIRFLQDVCTVDEPVIKIFQIDGELNPTDCLATWRDSTTRKRHYAFLMGKPELARKLWRESQRFKSYKPKKIVPAVKVPDAPDFSEHASTKKNAGIAAKTYAMAAKSDE